MNWAHRGQLAAMKGLFKNTGAQTDDQLDIIARKRDRLISVLQESYGVAKDEAEALGLRSGKRTNSAPTRSSRCFAATASERLA